MDFENPTKGRIVLYVLKNGETRPLTITQVEANHRNINGVLAFDGPNDRMQIPDVELRAEQLAIGTVYLSDIPFAELKETGAKGTPGTWHWPEKMSASASGR